MKKHCFPMACLFAVALACLPAAFTGHALAGSWEEQFILLIANTEANNVVAYASAHMTQDICGKQILPSRF